MDFSALAISIAIGFHGTPATYTPPAGAPVACSVVQHQGNMRSNTTNTLRFGSDVEVWRENVSFDIPVSDIPAPMVGGVIALDGGASYTIQAPPVRRDPARLIWTCDCSFGIPVVFRSLLGSGASQNPPTHQGLAIAAAATAGAGVIAVKSAWLVGQIRPGDTLAVGGVAYTVLNAVQASGNQVAGIQITPTLVTPVAVGDAVTPTWARDFVVRSGVTGYQSHEVTGNVQIGDLRIIILREMLVAAGFPGQPSLTDVVIPYAAPWIIKNITPIMQGNSPLLYEIQARGNG
ncbi:head-tail joining protein [Azospirillum canadense]|uniref:head-tail joining protein n=1 Tax=Azospirillum canadense TaxID=403962 RepID=UPI0022266CDA|nr:hypothetical protein [Azospirillum canadense]MCW2242258.1 hypothetical protein [Azospirillum canadense]